MMNEWMNQRAQYSLITCVLRKNYFLLLISEFQYVPEVDIAFAIQASTANAEGTFSQIRDTIKTIIDRYGTKKIHYAIIVYADTATTKLNFGERDQLSSDDALKQVIDSIPRAPGEPAVEKALEEAKKLFESPAARPQALKVLLI